MKSVYSSALRKKSWGRVNGKRQSHCIPVDNALIKVKFKMQRVGERKNPNPPPEVKIDQFLVPEDDALMKAGILK
ncbi:hypothetical protein CEXT_703051 [Caerostris extrusa]|uniref:Uncharacterized protein n=1 Tax=Caerostris extrusa TaxID=172846 RepID=A0AAV4XVM8_CAEEX|nr:hypothetical protein CEXT_703051 [Caerostris extrusa]